MFTSYQPFLMYAVTSVHAGSGSEIGIVDLPIQREKHTAFPKLESSTIKGAWRRLIGDRIEDDKKAISDFFAVFGSSPKDTNDNESQASAIAFMDGRILLFPVRSLKGTFAWITCPYVIQRFNRELASLSLENQAAVKDLLLPVPEAGTVSGSALLINGANGRQDKSSSIVLEEYTFEVKQSPEAKELADKLAAWMHGIDDKLGISNQLVILNNDEFTDFVQMSTEVNARIRINDDGQVDNGALWYEENIPPETLFYSVILIGQPRATRTKGTGDSSSASDMNTAADVERYIMKDTFPEVIQLGGDATIGKGILRNLPLKGVEK